MSSLIVSAGRDVIDADNAERYQYYWTPLPNGRKEFARRLSFSERVYYEQNILAVIEITFYNSSLPTTFMTTLRGYLNARR